MRFSINLATGRYRDQKAINRVIAIIIILLVAPLLYFGYKSVWSMGELSRIKSEKSALLAGAASGYKNISENEYLEQKKEIALFNPLLEKRRYNWLEILDKLEEATPDGIAITNLQREKDGALSIKGNAKNFKTLQDYIQRLENSSYFAYPLLLSHTNINQTTKGEGITFAISCKRVNG